MIPTRGALRPLALASLLVAAGAPAPAEEPTAAESRARVIRFLEDRVARDPDDIVAQNRLAGSYVDELRATGDLAWLARARAAADRSLEAVPAALNSGGLLARARVRYQSHQFSEARDDARELVKLASDKATSYQVLGDASLELGDYVEAAAAYAKMEALEADSVDTQARLARLALVRGNNDQARQHYESALGRARSAVPPDPELIAWCQVQLGQLDFDRGEWDDAEKRYRAALDASPESYLALDHLAELAGARGQFDDAAARYQQLIARVPRPELSHALGDLHLFAGKPAEAKPWHDRALQEYLRSVSEGHVYYLHHLVSFYTDAQENPQEALAWANKDLAIRRSTGAYDGLAWALFRNGRFEEARDAIAKALAAGAQAAHVTYHAAMIHLAAGDAGAGKEWLRRTAEINPRYNTFHVHR